MAAQIRVLRRRIRSTQSIKKITRAMELIATSRIAKARARVEAAKPYAEQMTAMLTELASNSALDQQRVVQRRPLGDLGEHRRDLLGVGPGLVHPGPGLRDP